eukprot:scaffold81859_cov29-Prasinocladus_malaysianus.AAC.1
MHDIVQICTTHGNDAVCMCMLELRAGDGCIPQEADPSAGHSVAFAPAGGPLAKALSDHAVQRKNVGKYGIQ